MSVKMLNAIDITAATNWYTVYTCPAGKTTVVSRVIFNNNHATNNTEFLLLAGASVLAQYYVFSASNTPPNGGAREVVGGIVLNAGESLYAYSTQTGGTCAAWGDEMPASSTLKQLGAISITQNAWSTVYQVPTGKTTIISKIVLNNYYYGAGQTDDATMHLAHIPSGQSVASKYHIVSGQEVMKNGGHIEIKGGIVLSAGDILSAKSDLTGGTCAAWGDEQSAGTAKMLGAIDAAVSDWLAIYTVPAGKQTIVSKVILTNNNTTSDAAMYLMHIPSGQSDAVKYRIINNRVVLKNGGQIEITGGICMATGDVLCVYTNVATCNAIAWGDEVNA